MSEDRETKKGASVSVSVLAAVLGTAIISGGGVYYLMGTSAAPATQTVSSNDTVDTPEVKSPDLMNVDVSALMPIPVVTTTLEPVYVAPVTEPSVTVTSPVQNELPHLLESTDSDVADLLQGVSDMPEINDVATGLSADVSNAIDQAILLSPEIAMSIEQGRILPEGASTVEWSQQNLGYIGKAEKGDIIPGLDQAQSAPEEWTVGDQESEGGGGLPPKYSSISGKISFNEDGNIIVDNTPVVLSGVVLPNADTQCFAGDGTAYDCMTWAKDGLAQYMDGKMAVCSISEMMGQNYALCDVMIDPNGRAIDLASWAVSAGIALANDYPARSLYYQQEADAKTKKAGIWEGSFIMGDRVEGEVPAEQ